MDFFWKDLTSAEIKTLWLITKRPTAFAQALLAKFKEKNLDHVQQTIRRNNAPLQPEE
jgi:hypothetical protein